MKNSLTVRECREADFHSIETLYPQAFPDEDLLPLVRKLLGHGAVTNLVCEIDGTVVGHIAFTRCSIDGHDAPLSLLGPLAVLPAHQRSGVGSRLISDGTERLKACGFAKVLVLGDPAYYGRFGFEGEPDIDPPYRLPDEWRGAWQSLVLSDEVELAGALKVPEPWQEEALWLP